MENKQRSYSNSGNTSVDETLVNETIPKHVHQHKTAPQHMRLFQYGLKTSNYQNTQINQPSPHQHQPPLSSHVHQHQHRIHSPYQATPTHPHVQHIPHQHQPNSPNLYQQPHVHQYQQKQNQDHYCYQPTKPVLYLNNLNQNQNVQDWVSRQSPGHYHPQQQYKEKPHNDHSPNNPSIQQSKLKEIDRKKLSGSNNQHLRSPSAKRPLEAPVTLQGWLYKQGSDGLMLWKKRWFVLSEYCLFYYKSQEEEKILGSILLPSYKVSVCGPEDKINKKFSFKCEHANMRTYILAADSQELMTQWIHVLNMACLLQNVNETKTHLSSLSSPHQYMETSDLRHTPSVQIPNLRSNLSHSYMSSNTTDMSSPSQQELSQYSQPLYANAPPKPRRLTDGYISPGSEIFDKHSDESKYVTLQQPHLHNAPHTYVPQNPAKSPINIYENRQAHLKYLHAPVQQQICKKYLHVPEYDIIPVRENHNIERRTPDTYGRSKLNSPKETRSSDYEDIYSDQAMYKRPLSPMMYTSNNRLNPTLSMPVARPPTAIEINGLKNNLLHLQHPQKIPNVVPRPHSADFLEYEVKRHNPNVIARQPRPKSSLDINRNTNNDNYFYTEERYAEKMRNSAQYLPKTPKYSGLQDEYLEHQQKWLTKPNKFETDNTFPFIKSNSRAMNFTDSNLQNLCKNDSQPLRSRSVLSVSSLSKEVDMDLYDFDKETTPTFHNTHGQPYECNDDLQKHPRDYDQFTRSASARLTQNNYSETAFLNREGERKREESMKRLLEWKQRMLQSPLNRKVNQQGISKGAPGKFNSYYKPGESGCPSMLNVDMYLDNTVNSALPHYNSYSSDDEASGSISVTTRDTYPRRVPAKKIWNPNSRQFQMKSTMLPNKNYDNDFTGFHRPQYEYYMAHDSSQHDLSSDTSQSSNARRANWQFGDKMNVSAGELLGRTHEELVLLLIQLRRQSANNYNAIEACYNEIDSIQSKLPKLDNTKRLETLQKLERIKQHLLELEKQYEKGKPLVNLVDNMVKLGSLYRYPKDHNSYPDVKDRLEFNQQMQERRLLAEERRDWNRTSLNQAELQIKVQQLYQLDNLIQEESETLQGLQQDKEEIERALNGLRQRLIKGFKDPAEVEQARKQQIMLENELSRVHSMLAQNSRKLEETIAGNARLEQELLVLKQKLQISKQQRSSPQISNAGDSLPCVIGTSAMLESDLHRVQQNVGDLQRQRQELSIQVKQLTDRSNTVQQLRSFPSTPTHHQTQGNRKKINSQWRETDLDTMNFVDHGEQAEGNNSTNPVYINTNINQTTEQEHATDNFKLDDYVPDNTFYNQNSLPQEKQEIKTVRIVKRESERRQRDREKTVSGKWDAVTEEDDSSQTSSIYFRSIPLQKNQSSINLETISTNKIESDKYNNGILNKQNSLSHPNLPHAYADVRNTSNPNMDRNLDNSAELSPTFKSEAAKQIITEISSKQTNRRLTPKEKRRHYTAPYNNLIMKSLNQLPTDAKDFDKLNIRRARDDLDMERALRQRIDAPDVVRSTLSSKEFKYNESTIDNILGTPNKIFIPERYVPEQLPQLSVEEQQHRLRKVESIKKMLSDTTIISGSSNNLALEETNSENSSNDAANKVTSKMIEEKKQRQHLLQLNQILAKQVMEMSKIVAGSNNPGE